MNKELKFSSIKGKEVYDGEKVNAYVMDEVGQMAPLSEMKSIANEISKWKGSVTQSDMSIAAILCIKHAHEE